MTMSTESDSCKEIFLVQGNCGQYVVSLKEKQGILFLTPTGLRLASQKDSKYIKILIRIEDGKRLFWKEHIRQLQLHCEELYLPIPSADELEDLFWSLWHLEAREDSVLRIVVSKKDIIIHYATYTPFSSKIYQDGISCEIISFDREDYWEVGNQDALTKNTLKAMKQGKEYLLLDEEGVIYKGTRSNVYFLTDEGIKTANCDLSLHGVTRKLILEAIKLAGFNLQEDDVKRSDLYSGRVKAAFLVSSLTGIIPIANIDEHILDPKHPFIAGVKHEYEKLLEELKDEDV